MSGGRRLWESKDDRKWGHDKFEELTVEQRNYDDVTALIYLLFILALYFSCLLVICSQDFVKFSG